MRVIILGTEQRVGKSKDTGNPYAMYTLHVAVPVPLSQQVRTSEHNILNKAGYQYVSMQSNEAANKMAADQATKTHGFPVHAELVTEPVVGRGNQIQNEIMDMKFNAPPAIKAAAG